MPEELFSGLVRHPNLRVVVNSAPTMDPLCRSHGPMLSPTWHRGIVDHGTGVPTAWPPKTTDRTDSCRRSGPSPPGTVPGTGATLDWGFEAAQERMLKSGKLITNFVDVYDQGAGWNRFGKRFRFSDAWVFVCFRYGTTQEFRGLETALVPAFDVFRLFGLVRGSLSVWFVWEDFWLLFGSHVGRRKSFQTKPTTASICWEERSRVGQRTGPKNEPHIEALFIPVATWDSPQHPFVCLYRGLSLPWEA